MLSTNLKLSVLSILVASSFGAMALTSEQQNETLLKDVITITPSTSLNKIKSILGTQKQIMQLDDLSSYDENVLDMISRLTFINRDVLVTNDNASLYIDGGNIIYIPGVDSKDKIMAVIDEDQSSDETQPYSVSPQKSTAPEQIDYYTLTTSLGDMCDEPDLDAHFTLETLQKVTVDFTQSLSAPFEDIYDFENAGVYSPTVEESNRAGCKTAIAKVKIYLSNQSVGGPNRPTRNVEVKYKGLLKSINNGGYIYDNGSNGNGASLTGFVDELRFVTNFRNGQVWRQNNDLTYPLPSSSNSCDSTASFENSKTNGWDIGGTASGEVGDESQLGISVSGGYDSSTTISNSTSITCSSDLFDVYNGYQTAGSRYFDDTVGLDSGTSLYSSFKLSRIGDETQSQYQSSQPFHIGERTENDLVANLISFQKSLDENNREQRPTYDSSVFASWPYTTHIAHNPFYTNPGAVLPEEIRDGIELNSTLTYYQEYTSESNRYEEITPRIETWYNPGYYSIYKSYLGYNFALAPLVNREVTKRVTFLLPTLDIDWLDQRFMPVKTLGVESVTGSKKYISRNQDGSFSVKQVPYNQTDFAKPFPLIEQEHVFYMTNLISGDPNDKFQGFEINTYRTDENGTLQKQCLGVQDGAPTLMGCGLSNNGFSDTVWRYLTTSYVNISEPAYDRSDFTICLRDTKVEGEHQCLTVNGEQLVIEDYANYSFGETAFQWNLVDLATNQINYRDYYNQDP